MKVADDLAATAEDTQLVQKVPEDEMQKMHAQVESIYHKFLGSGFRVWDLGGYGFPYHPPSPPLILPQPGLDNL